MEPMIQLYACVHIVLIDHSSIVAVLALLLWFKMAEIVFFCAD